MIVGGASDGLDGFIARRYHATSIPGGLLDGIADKLLTLAVLATLTVEGGITVWQAGLVLARDVVVAAIVVYPLAARRSDALRHMPSRLAGKITTAAVFVWFTALLIPVATGVSWTVWTIAAVASSIAAVDYVATFLRRRVQLRAHVD